jgi:hypothetical protein
MDLTDPARATHLVETFVLPGIGALHDSECTATIDITPFESPGHTDQTDPTPQADHTDHTDHTDQGAMS